MTDFVSEAYARALDAANPLAPLRARFYLPPDTIYLDGNSLGLCSGDAEAEALRALDEWKRLAIGGWLNAEPPWFTLGEELGALTAPLVGAEPEAVVVGGTTTVNLHALAATFYQPTPGRRAIVATELDFPSDLYALRGLIALHGGNPANDLRLVSSRDGRTVDEADIEAALASAALAVLPSVLYRSGQRLDLARLAAAGRERSAIVGFDCAHSVGAMPHAFDEWGVDFAFWCSYKYLNGGPGAPGGLYVNRRHWGAVPALAGWWGYDKARQFDMALEWRGAAGAGAWQISTPSPLAGAPLRGSLRLFAEAGIEHVRATSLALTDYLMDLLDATGLTAPPFGYAIGTPREAERRGGHVAVEHPEAARIAWALKARGIIPDFRPPNVVRLAPAPLSTTFHELWQTVRALKEIVERGEHLAHANERGLVA
ncbi:MAG TPA: kynureninase [Thermomicrobiales bacterium]|jgi:kynureninase|nr:kynureninase [Thermomicrobiales bacterium]